MFLNPDLYPCILRVSASGHAAIRFAGPVAGETKKGVKSDTLTVI